MYLLALRLATCPQELRRLHARPVGAAVHAEPAHRGQAATQCSQAAGGAEEAGGEEVRAVAPGGR